DRPAQAEPHPVRRLAERAHRLAVALLGGEHHLGDGSAATTGESAGGAQQAVASYLGLPPPPRTTAAERPFAVDHQVADLAGVPLDAAERLSVHQETTTHGASTA